MVDVIALALLEIDPDIVRPGWVSGLVTIFIGVALVVLFFSLRKQVRRINPNLPYADELDADGAGGEGRAGRVDPTDGLDVTPSSGDRPAPDITAPKR